MGKGKDGKAMILFKHHSMELFIENEYELVLRMFSKNRFVEVIRHKIAMDDATVVNTLVVAFEQGKQLFVALNGRKLSLAVDTLSRSDLFNLKKSEFVLLGHKCTSGDEGSPQNLFNGYLFEFCIYNKVFQEFEMRAFEQQCRVHIERYRKMLDKH